MKNLLLPLVLLLAGCAHPGAQRFFDGLASGTAVPFQDGRVLGMKDHRPAWLDLEPKGDLRALGFTPCKPNDRVTIRTLFGENPAYILHVEGPHILFVARDPIYPGMSGAGLWRSDRWLAGVVTARQDGFPTLGEATVPFVEGE